MGSKRFNFVEKNPKSVTYGRRERSFPGQTAFNARLAKFKNGGRLPLQETRANESGLGNTETPTDHRAAADRIYQ